MTIVEAIIAAIVVFASLMMLTTAVALWRTPNALSRANLISPAVCVGLPLLVIAKLGYDITHIGFNPFDLVRAFIAITALLTVTNVASYYVARAIHGVEKNIIVIDPPSEKQYEKFSALPTPTLVHAGQTATTSRDNAIKEATSVSRQHHDRSEPLDGEH